MGEGGAYNAKKILYISQSKRAKGRKARKKGARSGDARNGVREAWTPCPPPPLLFKPGRAICLRDILG